MDWLGVVEAMVAEVRVGCRIRWIEQDFYYITKVFRRGTRCVQRRNGCGCVDGRKLFEMMLEELPCSDFLMVQAPELRECARRSLSLVYHSTYTLVDLPPRFMNDVGREE